MLVFAKIAAGGEAAASALAAHLLEATLPGDHKRAAEYYLRTAGLDPALLDAMSSVPVVRDDIDPRLAKALGLKPGAISESELANIIAGRKADGATVNNRKGGNGKKISGMDLCFTVPKSVSVAWAFARPAEQASIVQAMRDANGEALKYVEEEVGTRKGKAGAIIAASKFAWISVEHFTARPTVAITRPDPKTGVVATEVYTVAPSLRGDMHLHTHNIVPNFTMGDDGKLTAINTNVFKDPDKIKEFGAVFEAILARNLRAMGVEVALDKNNLASLPIIPQAVCDEFSKRNRDSRKSAIAEAASRGLEWESMSADAKVDFLKGGAKASRKSKTDDLASFEAWRAQAAALGWTHDTAITRERHAPYDLSKAVDAARPMLAEELEHRTVITGATARLQIARGMIATGIRTAADIGDGTRFMVGDGVFHDGRWTELMYAETTAGVRITTLLHKEQEDELVALAREAMDDTRLSLAQEEIDRAVAASGFDFASDHGKDQLAALTTLGTDGGCAVVIGVAGAGKTSLLAPLVAAYRARGCTVWGTSISRKTANDLQQAGIDPVNTRALDPLLDGLSGGRTAMGPDHVVFLDEISKVGTRQLLGLLRLRKKHGFKIIAAGDPKQTEAIMAGEVFSLLRRAFGAERIPELLNTIRQKSDCEREIAGLFRAGRIEQAIAMKRKDDTAVLIDGGRETVIEHIAELAGSLEGATLSAPTNQDAHDISAAIRKRRGLTGGMTVDGIDQNGREYQLDLAVGDKVRLFRTHYALFGGKSAQIGNNGSVLTVARIGADGLLLRGASGKEGFVAWDKLKQNGRVELAYGDCLTLDAAQGITSDVHICCAPSGTAQIDNFRIYVGMSRHKHGSWFVGSTEAEALHVKSRRMMGENGPITEDVLWANVTRNLSRVPKKDTATEFFEQMAALEIDVKRGFQKQARATEAGVKTDAKRKATVRQWARERVRRIFRMPLMASAQP